MTTVRDAHVVIGSIAVWKRSIASGMLEVESRFAGEYHDKSIDAVREGDGGCDRVCC